MEQPTLAWPVVLATGGYVLLCIPAILLAERFGVPQAPFHITQFVATVACFVSAGWFLWRVRGVAVGARRTVAILAVSLSGLWLLFIAFVIVGGALVMRDFD